MRELRASSVSSKSSHVYPAMRMLSMTVAPTVIPASSPTCKSARLSRLSGHL